MRHRDHRFEWTRAEFADWARRVAAAHGYDVRLLPVGTDDPEVGPPTQMAAVHPQRADQPADRTHGQRRMSTDAAPAAGTPRTRRCSPIPELALVVLVGISGSGKSSFARRHFRPTQVLSSDACRGMVADDENDQAATPAAFDVLHYIAATRLRAGRLTVVDATNVKREDRAKLVQLARDHDVLPGRDRARRPRGRRGRAQRRPRPTGT